MKTVLLLFICGICSWVFYTNAGQGKRTVHTASPKKDTINFLTQVQPVLQKNCSPCHFPGGKLYAALPFDKGSTIIDHATGVFKRIKKEGEAKLIREYIDQNKGAK